MPVQLILAGQHAIIEFLDTELPEKLPFGGKQLTEVHQLIGGRRVLDAMGPSDMPLAWSGVFLAATAVDRARFCDTLRRTGEQCDLNWDEFVYTGAVTDFEADYRFGGLYIPYRITFTVGADQTAFLTVPPPPSVQAQVTTDMNNSGTLTSLIGDSSLTSLNGNVVSSVMGALGSIAPIAGGLATLTNSGTLSAVSLSASQLVSKAVGYIAGAQARAQTLIGINESLVTGITAAGTTTPGNPITGMLGQFGSQASAASVLPSLYNYNSLLSRTTTNLNAMTNQGTAKTITVGGGTLQQVAAQQYGDATQWQTIAQANNLTDPVISGIHDLTIPPAP